MASKRKTIGVIYNVNPKWMGGVIYILNTIKILNWLKDEEKPHIRLYYRNELKLFVDEIKYPYLEKIPTEFPRIKKGYFSSWFSMKNKFFHNAIMDGNVDALFPVMDFPISCSRYPNIQLVSWITDLQHKFYPEFISKKKLVERELRIRLILANSKHLVLSSKNVLDDIHEFYDLKDIKTHIYHFASVIDNFNFSGWDRLRTEKGLPEEYFMVCNQFLKHKNHKAVLEALVKLNSKGLKPVVAFTGKIIGNLSSQYIDDLCNIIRKNKLENQIFFLGILSRQEQLTLMRYSKAIIQPSLFEGWSTVIEDAISLQTPVIASNIEVNKEQLGDWAVYFNPINSEELAKLIEKQAIIYESYDQRIKKAAQAFISIFKF